MRFLRAVCFLTAVFIFPLAGAESPSGDLGYMLSPEAKSFTKESIVEIQGITYRRVDYRNSTYFFQLMGAQGSAEDLKILCENPDPAATALVRVGVRVMERTHAFVEGLQMVCKNARGGRMTTASDVRLSLMPALAVGFTLDDGVGKSIAPGLKNKRLIVWPYFGFAAETP
ncbi:MAG: hypothetical protein KF767_01605 [Bdellovibrionaceae bacterium]|nr:hypothetical protein [Pseudobdellovibrionaceae bacterium]